MSDHLPVRPANTGRRSQQVALVLLGTMGVVGGVVAWDAWRRAGLDENTPVEQGGPPAAPVAADRTYANNDYVPGAGYYHAPYHAWYPHPYNYHDPARGYFGGGLWQAVPFILAMQSSQPSPGAASSALAAQQRYEQEQRARSRPSYFNFGSNRRRSPGGLSFFSPSPSSPGPARPTTARPSTPSPTTSKPSAQPSTSKPSIQRGGFGSSGHSSGGGSGS